MTKPLDEARERMESFIDLLERGIVNFKMTPRAAADLRLILAALPQSDEETVERVIEICAQIADMHDHKGDTGKAIRQEARAAIQALGGGR